MKNDFVSVCVREKSVSVFEREKACVFVSDSMRMGVCVRERK